MSGALRMRMTDPKTVPNASPGNAYVVLDTTGENLLLVGEHGVYGTIPVRTDAFLKREMGRQIRGLVGVLLFVGAMLAITLLR